MWGVGGGGGGFKYTRLLYGGWMRGMLVHGSSLSLNHAKSLPYMNDFP